MAARFANWLHNGKADEKAAFESGAYDTSTFYWDDSYQHQVSHDPGTGFWIPTLDEFTKAAYWDPDKNGGEGGYSLNPDGGDETLIAALPQDGGETIGDALGDPNYFLGEWDLGQYPHVQSPWGLRDVSGSLPQLDRDLPNPPHGGAGARWIGRPRCLLRLLRPHRWVAGGVAYRLDRLVEGCDRRPMPGPRNRGSVVLGEVILPSRKGKL